METAKKKVLLFCTCSGACPSMTKIDFWALAERVRLEFEGKIEFMALHPRLCEPDGERFMSNILKEGIVYITPACKENKQQKLLRDGFEKAGVPMDADHWLPISMALEDTDAVFQKIKAAVEGVIGERQTGKE
jgi:hypothetical protein